MLEQLDYKLFILTLCPDEITRSVHGKLNFINVNFDRTQHIIYVTSCYSISYCSSSEYWTQKRTQNGNFHSMILDV